MKGQISLEFILIFSALLMIFAGISVSFYQTGRADSDEGMQLADAKRAAILLVNALNSVYLEGVGARQTVEYWAPPAQFCWVNENGRLALRLDLGFDVLISPSLLPADNLVRGWIENTSEYSFHRTTIRYVSPDNLYVSDRIVRNA